MLNLKNLGLIVCGFVVLQSGTPIAHATGSYGYFPDLNIMLGKGFDPQHRQNDYRLCFAGQRVVSLNNSTADNTRLEMTIVRSTRDLKRALGVDTRLDVSYLVYSGHAQFSYTSETEVNANDVNILVQGVSTYSGETLDFSQMAYTQEIQALINARNYRQVQRICGPELVNTVKKGTRISALIRIQGLTESEKNTMDLRVSGSAGFGPLSAQAEVHVNSLFRQSNSRISISAEVFTQGGNGLSSFSDLVDLIDAGPDSLAKIKDGIKKVMADLTPDKAAIIGFSTVEFPSIQNEQEDLVSDFKLDALAHIVESYRYEKAKFDHLNSLFNRQVIRRESPPEFDFVSMELLSEAQVQLPQVRNYLMLLARIHERCRMDQSESLDNCALPDRPYVRSYDMVQDILQHR